MSDLAPVIITGRLRSAGTAAPEDAQFRRAKAIALAGEAVPKVYRENPGSVLLLMEWAAEREVSLITAMQTVSFVAGRPIIGADMQRALAVRAGVGIRVLPPSADSATVEITLRDGRVESSTYTLDDARNAGLLSKDTWRQHPKAMLVARATSQGLRWHAPEVTLGMLVQDEVDDGSPAAPPDIIQRLDAMLATPPPPVRDVVDLAEVVDAEVADEHQVTKVDIEEAMRASGTKLREVLGWLGVNYTAGPQIVNITGLIEHPDAANQVLQWLRALGHSDSSA